MTANGKHALIAGILGEAVAEVAIVGVSYWPSPGIKVSTSGSSL